MQPCALNPTLLLTSLCLCGTQHPKQLFVVASLDYMHIEAEVRPYLGAVVTAAESDTCILCAAVDMRCTGFVICSQGIAFTPTIALYNKGKKVRTAVSVQCTMAAQVIHVWLSTRA